MVFPYQRNDVQSEGNVQVPHIHVLIILKRLRFTSPEGRNRSGLLSFDTTLPSMQLGTHTLLMIIIICTMRKKNLLCENCQCRYSQSVNIVHLCINIHPRMKYARMRTHTRMHIIHILYFIYLQNGRFYKWRENNSNAINAKWIYSPSDRWSRERERKNSDQLIEIRFSKTKLHRTIIAFNWNAIELLWTKQDILITII